MTNNWWFFDLISVLEKNPVWIEHRYLGFWFLEDTFSAWGLQKPLNTSLSCPGCFDLHQMNETFFWDLFQKAKLNVKKSAKLSC